jgi:hypothetical protein
MPVSPNDVESVLINVFDEQYAARLRAGVPDDGSAPNLAPLLGLPRTFYASYTFNF